MRNIDSAPTVRATYLLEKYLEERIIATYLTLLQQPIYDSSFCGNLLASPTLDVHPLYPWVLPQRYGDNVSKENTNLKDILGDLKKLLYLYSHKSYV